MSLPYVDSINLIGLRGLVKSMAFEMQQVTNHLSMPVNSMVMDEPPVIEETIDFFGTSEPEPALEPSKPQIREDRGKARRRDKRREVREGHEPISKSEDESARPKTQRRESKQRQASASSEPAEAEAPVEVPTTVSTQVSVEVPMVPITPPELELVDITALERELLASPVRKPDAEASVPVELSDAAPEGVARAGEEAGRERKKRYRRGSRHEKSRPEMSDIGLKAEGIKETTVLVKETVPVKEATATAVRQETPVVVAPPVRAQSPATTVLPSPVNVEVSTELQTGKSKNGGHHFRGGQRKEKVEGKEYRKQPRRASHQPKGPTGAIQPPPQRNQ